MNAFQIAKAWQEENSTRDFLELCGHYLSHGILHSTQDCFLAAMPVQWDPETQRISWEGEPNAYFVELAAGTKTNPVREMLRVAPRPLPFILFCRGAFRLHAWEWNRLARKVGLNH